MSSKKDKTAVIDGNKLLKFFENAAEQKAIEIRSASLRDQLCNYSYELLTGKTKGDAITRKGVHIIHDDLIEKMKELDVFLAHIDGAFRDANNQTPIQKLEAEDCLALYEVTGFKITGVEENKSIILVGHKEVPQGTISFETPKIKISGSTYLYIEELSNRLFEVIEEVEQYMDGKTAPFFEQSAMTFEEEDDMDLEGASVDNKHFADTEKE
jgi:hypothetical protein